MFSSFAFFHSFRPFPHSSNSLLDLLLASLTLKASPSLQWVAGIVDDTERAAVCADPATVWAVDVESKAIATLADNLDFKPTCPTSSLFGICEPTEESAQRLAAAVERVARNQAAPLDIVDLGGNVYSLATPGWWSVPGGDLVAQALALHSALVEAGQRFCLVTSDVHATVSLLLSGPTPPKAALVWLAADDDDAPEARAAMHPRVEQSSN